MKLEPIDTSATAGKARVMQLAAEGRGVAWRDNVDATMHWYRAAIPKWDWRDCDYAIIAEQVGPDEVWLTYNEDGKWFATSDHCPEWQQPGISHIRYRRVEE